MCGRFTVTRSIRQIQERFDVPNADVKKAEDLFSPNYNVAPTDRVPVVLFDGTQNRLELMRWGLIPPWAKDEKSGAPLINARDDGIAEKPAFRDSIPSQRCLVVADGFYEFHAVGKTKRPIRYVLRDKSLFAFAGLYAKWIKPDANTILLSCTIITTEPNSIVARIHNRMPVILPKESEKHWLDPRLESYGDIKRFLLPMDASAMAEYYANPAVNSVKNKGEYLIEPFESNDLFGNE
jgi:putative SOS response-associated peptidase YedK